MNREDCKIVLMQKIEKKSIQVGVIGLGYVGLPFAVEKAKVGLRVCGFDVNEEKVDLVNRGVNYIGDVKDDELRDTVAQGYLRATTDWEKIGQMDVLIICVPTPLDKYLIPDLNYINSAVEAIGPRLRPGVLISLESTTFPGTTDEIVLPRLEELSGLRCGKDFFLANSPERVDPGNRKHTTKNTNKVVGGCDPDSLEVAIKFYSQAILSIVPVSSAKIAEMSKVFENSFRAINIAFANEIAILCHKMGINVWEMMDAAFTKPFGIMPFYPGPGVGGHCIPLDPHYLEWKAKEYGFFTRFISLAGEINRSMPSFVVERVQDSLNRSGLALSKSKILVLGVAYKNDITDVRESPVLDVIKSLREKMATVEYYDPFVPSLEEEGISLESSTSGYQAIDSFDLVLIGTSHSVFDYCRVVREAKIIFDTRNATRLIGEDNGNIVKL